MIKYNQNHHELVEMRFQALNFLVSNYDEFPSRINTSSGISNRKFKNFRFVQTDEGIFFANMIVNGIGRDEFIKFKSNFKSISKRGYKNGREN